MNFIFHTGFCCSTLLARCLDQKGVCLSLKEPNILNSLSQTRYFAKSEPALSIHRQKLKLSLALLFRTFSKEEAILIKPSNIDTVLLEDILDLRQKAKVGIIYSGLKNFLISVAKGDQPRRDFARRLLALFLADFQTRKNYDRYFFGKPENLLWNLNDLHIAAAIWRLQMKYLEEAGGKNVYWLNCKDFLLEPTNTVSLLNDFFGFQSTRQGPENSDLEEKLTRHAKAPAFPYSPTIREKEFMAIENYLGGALTDMMTWAEDSFAPLIASHTTFSTLK